MVEQKKGLPQAGDAPERLHDTIAVWTEMKSLSDKFGCTSLGEGAPNMMPPKFLRDEMIKAIDDGHNQYCRSFGHPKFVASIAKTYGEKYFNKILGRPLDAMSEVLVTGGANGSLNCFISALCNKGDKVVSFEPMFPMYLDHIEMAGGEHVGVPLTYDGNDWVFKKEELRSALATPNVKVFIMNAPHNPTGKVFTLDEMKEISDIVAEFPGVVVLADEVYDFLTFDKHVHTPFASIGNNWERTVSIYSGGKLFNATGWKLGWSIGPAPIIKMGGIISNTVFYTGNTPGQIAMGACLENAFSEYTDMGHKDLTFAQTIQADFQKNRDFLVEAMAQEGTFPMVPTSCDGGYFLMVDVSKCRDLIPAKYLANHEYLAEGERVRVNPLNMADGSVPLDLAFCRWMACEKNLVMMPNSFFYSPKSPGMDDKYCRMALCKTFDSLKAGAANFKM